MKIKTTQLIVKIVLLLLISAGTSYSTIVNVSVQNFSFSPPNINVFVGDTIRWNWVNGSHTTTCDGTNGSIRPAGAPFWNSDMNSTSPTFTYVVTVAGSYHYVCIPHSPDMSGNIEATLSVITQINEIVNGYELSQNYPNPFNPTTNIKFSVANSSQVTLKVYNITGKEVATLVNDKLSPGSYRVDWNAVNFTSGIYYYRIRTEAFSETKKMLLIK
jgi:plastocyanin